MLGSSFLSLSGCIHSLSWYSHDLALGLVSPPGKTSWNWFLNGARVWPSCSRKMMEGIVGEGKISASNWRMWLLNANVSSGEVLLRLMNPIPETTVFTYSEESISPFLYGSRAIRQTFSSLDWGRSWEHMSFKQLSTHFYFNLVFLPLVSDVLGASIPQYLQNTMIYIGLILFCSSSLPKVF